MRICILILQRFLICFKGENPKILPFNILTTIEEMYSFADRSFEEMYILQIIMLKKCTNQIDIILKNCISYDITLLYMEVKYAI